MENSISNVLSQFSVLRQSLSKVDTQKGHSICFPKLKGLNIFIFIHKLRAELASLLNVLPMKPKHKARALNIINPFCVLPLILQTPK